MKQQTDALVASDEKLQQFLMWVSQKSLSLYDYMDFICDCKLAALQAFYFAVDRGIDRSLDQALSPGLDRALNRALSPATGDDYDRAFYPALDLALNLGLNLALEHAFDSALDLSLAMVAAFDHAFYRGFSGTMRYLYYLEPELKQALQQLKEQLPYPGSKEERFKQWWQANGHAWTSQLRALMIKHRNIGHDWEFSEQQKELLKQYYDANKLLVDCLNSSCNITPAVREEIEETLLLPLAEIEQRGSC
jgi:hypothetical protein